MGNTITHAVSRSSGSNTHCNNSTCGHNHSTNTSTTPRHQPKAQCYHSAGDVYYQKSKTLPARHSRQQSQQHQHQQQCGSTHTATKSSPPHGETSRMLFLLYLIHRTWNVMVETVDTRSKRSRRSAASEQHTSTTQAPAYYPAAVASSCEGEHYSINITDLDDVDASSLCCSQYSACSCSYCYDATQNVYNSIAEDCSTDSIYQRTVSRCGSEISTSFYQHDYQMAPSVCQNSPKLVPAPHNNATTTVTTIGGSDGIRITTTTASSVTQKSHCGGSSINGSMASYKMSNSENSWTQPVFSKENQRPPVYNPEDYTQSLKKFGKRQSGQQVRSVYDTSHDGTANPDIHKSSTLPHKHNEYKSPIPAPPESDSEMSLRQFASVTDLLTKLRADLRVSFPSFVQEFIATPADGVSLLLEVLRAIQLSQSSNAPAPATHTTASMPRNTQAYQRRALLDELACLQCLSICCTRSLEATARLGTTPVGLMPLASSATGQGIRARILAMQLMTAACDKSALGHGSQKAVTTGHTAVSEAMSTLRLRCSEPVRFRLLIGMLNSGGGSGELQAVGVKFINTFLESAENLQQRLYLQAELFQAGFEPNSLAKTISSSSPWLDTLRTEIKRFHELYVDVDKMITQARDADRVRSQMVILERRVQILHEEKAVLTSMERRLQERCAELQREIFRLQGAQNEHTFKSLDKQPVALPRHVPPGHSKPESEHEDEGISSSETGPSLSPVPILVLPQNTSTNLTKQHNKPTSQEHAGDDCATTTIEDVMEELDNIVSEAEKELCQQPLNNLNMPPREAKEKDIVPVNIVPQPPRKSRSLAHLVSQADGSELDGSEYGMLMLQNPTDQAAIERANVLQTFFDEANYDMPELEKPYAIESPDIPEVSANAMPYNASTTRELLDVIMNARHNEDDPTMKAFREAGNNQNNHTSNNHNHNHNSNNKPLNSCANKRNSTNAKAPPPPAPLGAKKPQAPAQQFNGVFFMTGMNTPQKYPKPDLSAALQARRVTKNVERLEAAFASHETLHDSSTQAHGLREKSRSNQQIYFGSNPTLRLTSSSYQNNLINGNNNNNCNNNNSTTINATTRTRSYTQGTKVTDIPSGLY